MLFSGIARTALLNDGRIAVANGEPTEIRIYSPNGAFVTRVGRRGRGPGEFQAIASMFPGNGDTLFAVNLPYFQLLRFSVTSGYVDMHVPSRDTIQVRLAPMRQAEGLREFLRNGSFIVSASSDGHLPEEVRFPTGKLVFPMRTAVWFPRDHSAPKTVGPYAGIEQMFIDLGNGQRTAEVPPGARRGMRGFGARGTRLCVAAAGTEVSCVDEDGSRLSIRWTQDAVPVPQSEIDAWKARYRSGGRTGSAQTAEQIIAGIIIPESRPPILAIVVATDGRVFVAGPDLPRELTGPIPYRMFSRTGELVGIAQLPAMGVHEVGDDYVLGVERDEDGVEFVVIYDVKSS